MLWPLSRLWPDNLGPFMRHERWQTALFLHWALPAALIQALLPPGLVVDDALEAQHGGGQPPGMAWLGLVLLSELGVGPAGCLRRWSPLVDHHGANVRVYVRGPDGPGIFFLSLECSSLLAAAGARLMAIPYWPASMARSESTDDTGERSYQLTGRRWFSSAAAVKCRWSVAVAGGTALGERQQTDNTESWARQGRYFVERYRLYTFRGGLYSGTIAHRPWLTVPAQVAELEQTLTGEVRHAATAS